MIMQQQLVHLRVKGKFGCCCCCFLFTSSTNERGPRASNLVLLNERQERHYCGINGNKVSACPLQPIRLALSSCSKWPFLSNVIDPVVSSSMNVLSNNVNVDVDQKSCYTSCNSNAKSFFLLLSLSIALALAIFKVSFQFDCCGFCRLLNIAQDG